MSDAPLIGPSVASSSASGRLTKGTPAQNYAGTTPVVAAIRRAVAKHGVAATLVRAGDAYNGESDTREPVTVLKRSYEGAETEGATGMETRKARWMIPAENVPFVPKPYDRLEIGDYVITIHRADPKYANGAIVRYDLEVAG